jgi:hypothetical protein
VAFGDDEPPAVRLTPSPATLGSPNRIRVLWITFVGWDFVHVRWAVNGGPETQLRLGRDQVDIGAAGLDGEWDLTPTIPGARYTVAVQACRQGGFGGFGAFCGPWSGRVQVMGATNLLSLRSFLTLSGVDTTRTVSIGALRPAAQTIALRALLAGG